MKLRTIRVLFISVIMVLAMTICSSAATLAVKDATGKVNSDNGANIRAKASLTADIVCAVEDNTGLTIHKEVFIEDDKTAKTNKWYQVTVKGHDGYIRSDLVDTVKYTTVTGKTTDTLNYRKGPNTTFATAGTLKKGAAITIVLKANQKGSNTVWYKIKKDSKYYYVIKKYTKLTSASSSSSQSKKTSTKVTVSVTDESLPNRVGKGCSFSLRGTVTASKKIDSIRFGIKKNETATGWVTSAKKEVAAKTFNIAEIDKDIAFAKLNTGTYYYVGYVYIDSKKYVAISKKFTVVKLKGPQLLANTAVDLAWSLEDSNNHPELYDRKAYPDTAVPTPNYQAAASALGISGRLDDCSVFIRTIIMSCGYDEEFPVNITKQWDYFTTSDKWTRVPTLHENYAEEAELSSGDICIYRKDESNWHICMYVKLDADGKLSDDGTGYIAEASRTLERYGFIRTGLSKLTNKNDKNLFAVYRAAS